MSMMSSEGQFSAGSAMLKEMQYVCLDSFQNL